jgi:tetratricopeptide (TPR) repeat protein
VYPEAVELLGPDHPLTTSLAGLLAEYERDFGNPKRADELLASQPRAAGSNWPPSDESSEFAAAKAAVEAVRLVEAERIASELLIRERRILGEDHPDAIGTLALLGFIAGARNESRLCEIRNRQAYELARRRFGDDGERTRFAARTLAEALLQDGRPEEALELADEVRSRRIEAGLPDQIEDMDLDATRTIILSALGRTEAAIDLQRDVVERVERLVGSTNRRTYQARSRLAQLLANTGRTTEGIEALTELHREMSLALRQDHPDTLDVQGALARLHDAVGDTADAESLLANRLERSLRAFGPSRQGAIAAQNDLTGFLAAHGRNAEALEAHRRYRERFQALATDAAATVDEREAFARWLMDSLPMEARDPLAAREILAADAETSDASAQVLMTYAKTYFVSGDVELALAVAERAAALVPHDEVIGVLVEQLRQEAAQPR